MLEEVTLEITAIRNPMNQLLSATLKADKAVKSAIEQLKKQAAKQQADASKAKKASGGQGPTQLALYDQGTSGATVIPRVAADHRFDLSKPFTVDCSSWASDIMKDGEKFRHEVDGFRDSFNDTRKKTKGVRVSRAFVDASIPTVLEDKLEGMFKNSGHVIPHSDLPQSLQDSLKTSLFAIDAGYDKVSAEFLGCATARLCIEGTRAVIMTEAMQLQGFMERKGIAGPIGLPKMSAFFRSMNVPLITEYQKECAMWSCTVAAGDLLFTPYGFVQGELVQQATIGCRVPLVCKHAAHENGTVAVKKRKEDVDRSVGEGGTPEAIEKMKQESSLLSDLSKAMSGGEEEGVQSNFPTTLNLTVGVFPKPSPPILRPHGRKVASRLHEICFFSQFSELSEHIACCFFCLTGSEYIFKKDC